jgi:TrkA-C domain
VAAALTVLVVISVSIVIIRVATSALVLTGMARESARFQARSAFLGVGFTTTEAESIVGHPVRRRIAMWLMWSGNAGIVSVVGSLVISFGGGGPTLGRIAIIAGGLLVLSLVARSRVVEHGMSRAIEHMLQRFTDVETRDYAGLLHIRGGWTVDELQVEPADWLTEGTLGELGLRDEGVLVLGIERADGGYEGAPHGDDRVDAGDVLVLYGRRARIAEIDERRRGGDGMRAHALAVAEQERLEAASGN